MLWWLLGLLPLAASLSYKCEGDQILVVQSFGNDTIRMHCQRLDLCGYQKLKCEYDAKQPQCGGMTNFVAHVHQGAAAAPVEHTCCNLFNPREPHSVPTHIGNDCFLYELPDGSTHAAEEKKQQEEAKSGDKPLAVLKSAAEIPEQFDGVTGYRLKLFLLKNKAPPTLLVKGIERRLDGYRVTICRPRCTSVDKIGHDEDANRVLSRAGAGGVNPDGSEWRAVSWTSWSSTTWSSWSRLNGEANANVRARQGASEGGAEKDKLVGQGSEAAVNRGGDGAGRPVNEVVNSKVFVDGEGEAEGVGRDGVAGGKARPDGEGGAAGKDGVAVSHGNGDGTQTIFTGHRGGEGHTIVVHPAPATHNINITIHTGDGQTRTHFLQAREGGNGQPGQTIIHGGSANATSINSNSVNKGGDGEGASSGKNGNGAGDSDEDGIGGGRKGGKKGRKGGRGGDEGEGDDEFDGADGDDGGDGNGSRGGKGGKLGGKGKNRGKNGKNGKNAGSGKGDGDDEGLDVTDASIPSSRSGEGSDEGDDSDLDLIDDGDNDNENGGGGKSGKGGKGGKGGKNGAGGNGGKSGKNRGGKGGAGKGGKHGDGADGLSGENGEGDGDSAGQDGKKNGQGNGDGDLDGKDGADGPDGANGPDGSDADKNKKDRNGKGGKAGADGDDGSAGPTDGSDGAAGGKGKGVGSGKDGAAGEAGETGAKPDGEGDGDAAGKNGKAGADGDAGADGNGNGNGDGADGAKGAAGKSGEEGARHDGDDKGGDKGGEKSGEEGSGGEGSGSVGEAGQAGETGIGGKVANREPMPETTTPRVEKTTTAAATVGPVEGGAGAAGAGEGVGAGVNGGAVAKPVAVKAVAHPAPAPAPKPRAKAAQTVKAAPRPAARAVVRQPARRAGSGEGSGEAAGGGGGGKSGFMAGMKKMSCFTGDTMVTTISGEKPMSELQVGDYVLVPSAQNVLKYERVEMFYHRQEDTMAKFVSIKTKSGREIKASELHLLPFADCTTVEGWTRSSSGVEDSLRASLFAHKAVAGQCVMSVVDGVVKADEIVKVGRVFSRGIYSPITVEGSIVANGVLASCFSQLESHNLQKVVLDVLVMFNEFFGFTNPSAVRQSVPSFINYVHDLSHYVLPFAKY